MYSASLINKTFLIKKVQNQIIKGVHTVKAKTAAIKKIITIIVMNYDIIMMHQF